MLKNITFSHRHQNLNSSHETDNRNCSFQVEITGKLDLLKLQANGEWFNHRQTCKAKDTTVSQHDLQAASIGVSMQGVIHTKFAFSRLEQYGYCL